jgi:hypothetical protein
VNGLLPRGKRRRHMATKKAKKVGKPLKKAKKLEATKPLLRMAEPPDPC